MIFDQIKKLSNVLMKKVDKMEVQANKCLKVRAVTSNCSACIDVCPINSIDITLDSIEVKESCIACGLCTSVCQTNALKWNHPPLIQLLNQLRQLSNRETEVYLACARTMKGTAKSNVVEVPCLGLLPAELWVSAGLYVPNLNIIYQSTCCDTCMIGEGERLFLDQKKEAEDILGQKFPVGLPNKVKEDRLIDHQRRRFLLSMLEEAKETNTITVKEVMDVDKTLSPFEKFDRYCQQQNEFEELAATAEEIKNNVIDKLLNDTVIHTDKRALLFLAFKKRSDLPENMTFFTPDIQESCSRCGACAFLCPTDAMIMDNQSIILSTNKCVSCGLCEEICYEKHIHMTEKKGTVFQDKFMYLLH
ncbi:4Fe-4S binding protein [Bacillus sp. MM2020_1]|nr:4Fe-4S binding protein [Bacillus sp. MM2020_1]